MRYLLIVLVLFSTLPNLYASDTPLIDPKMKKVEEGIEEIKKESCDKIKNIYNRMQCGKKLRVAARKEGKFRGYPEYCEKHYSSLKFKELNSLWKELKRRQATARHSSEALENDDRCFGEVSKEGLETEIQWLESRLARMQNDRIKEKAKKLGF